jgi:hypothetical protein
MNLITGFLYLLTAFLPVIVTALNFDIASFTPLQIFAVFWSSCLSVINLRIFILPIGLKQKSRSEFDDKSGLVALSHTFNAQIIFFIYSLLSGGLIALKAFVLRDYFPTNILVTAQVLLLVIVFLVLWGFLATMQIEERQSTSPNVPTPKQLADKLFKRIDGFKISHGLTSQSECVALLNSLYEKIRYQTSVTDANISSKEYKTFINEFNLLLNLLESGASSDTVKVEAACRNVMQLI